jgi:hypothetical protein
VEEGATRTSAPPGRVDPALTAVFVSLEPPVDHRCGTRPGFFSGESPMIAGRMPAVPGVTTQPALHQN